MEIWPLWFRKRKCLRELRSADFFRGTTQGGDIRERKHEKEKSFTTLPRMGGRRFMRWSGDRTEIRSAALQIVHGMAEYADRYDPVARYLADRGILVTGTTIWAMEKSVGENHPHGYFCHENAPDVLMEDVHSLRIRQQTGFAEQGCPQLPYPDAGPQHGFLCSEKLSVQVWRRPFRCRDHGNRHAAGKAAENFSEGWSVS